MVEIPAELQAKAHEARAQLVKQAAEQDDALMEKYLEGKELSEEEIRAAVRKGCIALKLFPVLCGSAFKHKGVQPLLDAVVDFLPSPARHPAGPGQGAQGRGRQARETRRQGAVLRAGVQDHDRPATWAR